MAGARREAFRAEAEVIPGGTPGGTQRADTQEAPVTLVVAISLPVTDAPATVDITVEAASPWDLVWGLAVTDIPTVDIHIHTTVDMATIQAMHTTRATLTAKIMATRNRPPRNLALTAARIPAAIPTNSSIHHNSNISSNNTTIPTSSRIRRNRNSSTTIRINRTVDNLVG
jgi:hypothetical protein